MVSRSRPRLSSAACAVTRLDPPVAQDDSITIDEDTPTTIPVLNNDTDEDVIYGDTITLFV